MSLLTACRALLKRRGATITGNGPAALRGHLYRAELLVLIKAQGQALSEGEKTAIDTVRRGGGLAFAVRTLADLEAELEVREA